MKKLISLLTMAILVLGVMPAVLAVSIGQGVTPEINTEDFAPMVWSCSDRVWADDSVEQQLYGRTRLNNYAFEGESISWTVLVMDKNGKEKIKDVYATIGDVQGQGNDIEVNCVRISEQVSDPYTTCEAKILEEKITSFNPDVMAMYKCTLTVETPESMYGEYWMTVEAEDMDGLTSTLNDNEYWFLNPTIALSIEGDLTFDNVRPGARATSSTLLVGNDADDGSGVLLDMFISGTDFYDSSSSGAMCSGTNKLALDAFTYDASNGAKFADDRSIRYGDTIAQAGRIVDGVLFNTGAFNQNNVLAPGAEMSITFQLDLPEPCNGDFDTGSIYFWGEAI